MKTSTEINWFAVVFYLSAIAALITFIYGMWMKNKRNRPDKEADDL